MYCLAMSLNEFSVRIPRMQVLSIDCLISGDASRHEPSVFYIKVLLHAFVPPLCVVVSWCVLASMATYMVRVQGDQRSWWRELVRDKWITAIIVTVFFMHPAV